MQNLAGYVEFTVHAHVEDRILLTHGEALDENGKAKGNEDNFQIYYMQRCMHGNLAWLGNNMVVNYKGALLQALLDMADWLQSGKEPLKTTVYKRNGSQIAEEVDAAGRGDAGRRKAYGKGAEIRLCESRGGICA